MKAFRLTMAVVLGALLLMSESVWAASAAQKQQKGGMQEMAPGGMQMQKGQTAPPIKVEATALTVTPASPQSGDQVTVKLTIKNTGTGTVAKVPWSIHYYTGNQTLAQGEQTNVGAGATFEVTATWQTKAAGWQKLQGYVDPTGKALANTAPVSSQIKELNVLVYQTQAKEKGGSAKLVTQTLNWQQAKNSGAGFTVNVNGPCGASQNGGSLQSLTAVVFTVSCLGPGGGKGDFEGYVNFTLKNNWHVKSYQIIPNTETAGSADWAWVSTPPSTGSTTPYVKFHLWADPTSYVRVGVEITIEGPQGTSPYTN